VEKNSIEVSSQFDFRGQTFQPKVVLDLDALMQQEGELPQFHQLLARENGIDLYSYEYEVLESSGLNFANATGMAGEFLQADDFDLQGFRRRWLQQRELEALVDIARRHLGVDTLEQKPGLREALLEAYRLGAKS